MLCNRCQKRDAKILYTEIINGVKKEQHLCEECATDYTSFQMEKPLMNSDLTLGDLLSTILESYAGIDINKSGEDTSILVCDQCGTTYEEFVQKGRFGCWACYHNFNEQLGKTFRSIQGFDIHNGKRPKGLVTSGTDRKLKNFTELERLTLKLHEAIEKEEFEEAARLRDLVKQMKKEEEANNA